jgi:hypothetical protein
MRVVDDYAIELPEGYVLDELPQPVTLDVGFAAYQSTAEMKGRTLHYARTYTIRQVTLPAERYPELVALSRAISTDEQSRAVLRKE